jgi:phage terminase large subunit GpA-like protein
VTKHVSAEDLLVERVLSLFAPPPRLSLADWAADNFRLAERASAEPGRFTPWPYQRFILDAIGDPAIERVTVLKAARVGFTKCLMAAIGASAATQPASIILLVPTDDDARGFAVDEVEPAFQESPALAGLLRTGRNDGRNTMVMKAFAGGGSLKILAARSPRNLRRHDAKRLFIDEADAMEVTVEGDAIALAIKRTFGHADRKIVMGSTPTLENISNVEKSWKLSNQTVFECPCPQCGEFFELQWEQLKWDAGKPETVHLVCPCSGCIIQHEQKAGMIKGMRARPLRPEIKDHVGFRLSALISLFANAAWHKLVAEFETAKAAGPSEMQVFVNTVLGRPFRLTQAQVDEDTLMARAEEFGLAFHQDRGSWDARLPAEALYITAGVDVQHDRLEVGLWGWCLGGVQALGHEVLTGDTNFPEVWEELDTLLQQRWAHPFGGTIGVEVACIDAGDSSGRQRSERLMAFAMARHGSCRTYAIKGASNPQTEPVKRAAKLKMPGKLFLLATEQFKADLWSRLELPTPQPGWMRFSKAFAREWFEQLLSEPPQIVYRRGRPEREFVRIPNRRAEVMDCFVYAAAARHFFRPDWERRAAELAAASGSVIKKPDATAKARELAELLRRK